MDKSMFSIKGKVAVVTGGARGMGCDFVQSLVENGASVAVLDVISASQAISQPVFHDPTKAIYFQTDISVSDQVSSSISSTVKAFGRVDICVCAAGVVRDSSFLNCSLEDLEFQLKVNTVGSFLVAQACSRVMAKQAGQSPNTDFVKPASDGGSIIFVASLATYQAGESQNISAYTASKGAVRTMIRPLAMELAPYGIRVNSISPGHILTDMTKNLGETNPDLLDVFTKHSFFNRMGFPREVSGMVVFLASDASSFITAQDLIVDGGASSW